jgi:hypothetical protein
VLGYNAATSLWPVAKRPVLATEPPITPEGITINTIAPSKMITIRKCDHQADYGIVIGTTVKNLNGPGLT